jgi:hypothetical protein
MDILAGHVSPKMNEFYQVVQATVFVNRPARMVRSESNRYTLPCMNGFFDSRTIAVSLHWSMKTCSTVLSLDSIGLHTVRLLACTLHPRV